MTDTRQLRSNLSKYIEMVDELEKQQAAEIYTKEKLEREIRTLADQAKGNKEAMNIATHAIDILRQVSDQAVVEAYKFLESSLNAALARMFSNTTRQIRLHEYTRDGQYPQLEIELLVGNGKKRSLKSDSGHGLAQIVSLLSILSLIVITNSRRILVMDEIISGLSVHNRKIVSDILWTFTDIGFQFIVNEHGYVPKGSKVYYLEMVGDVSHVKESYIEQEGVYLNNTESDKYGAGYTEDKATKNTVDSDMNNNQNSDTTIKQPIIGSI